MYSMLTHNSFVMRLLEFDVKYDLTSYFTYSYRLELKGTSLNWR